MKKLFCFLVLVVSTITAYGQVILNNVPEGRDPNEEFINGISTRSDIGGVDVEYETNKFNYRLNDSPSYGQILTSTTSLRVTNYNNFPVTFLYRYKLLSTEPGKAYSTTSFSNFQGYFEQWVSGSIVIPAAKDDYYPSRVIKNVSGNGGIPITVEDLVTITRKVGQ